MEYIDMKVLYIHIPNNLKHVNNSHELLGIVCTRCLAARIWKKVRLTDSVGVNPRPQSLRSLSHRCTRHVYSPISTKQSQPVDKMSLSF